GGAVQGQVQDGGGGGGPGNGSLPSPARRAVRRPRLADPAADAGRSGPAVGAATEDRPLRDPRRGGGALSRGSGGGPLAASGAGEGEVHRGPSSPALVRDALLPRVPGTEAAGLGGGWGGGGPVLSSRPAPAAAGD